MPLILLIGFLFSAAIVATPAAASVKVVAPSGKASSATSQAGDRAASPVSPEFFGMHIHHLDVPYPQGKSSWPFIPFGSWRLWGAYVEWKNLEPQKGNWDFHRLDRYVDEAGRHGTDLLLTLGRTPKWASARPSEQCDGCAAEPASIDDWKNYIRTVVRRYKGRIKYYEVWNEPRLPEMGRTPPGAKIGYYSGSVSALVDLAKAAKQVVSEEDPAAKIISPSFVSGDLGLRGLASFLKAGGGKYIDIVGFHYYVDVPEKIPDITRKLRNLLATYQLDQLPIWNTESGFTFERSDLSIKPGPRKGSFEDVLPTRLGAAYVARSLILGAAGGLKRFYWFNWDGEPPHPTHGIAAVRGTTATPMTRAYQNTRDWLLGAVVGPCGSQPGNIWTCNISLKGGRNAWIIWAANDQDIAADLSAILSEGFIRRLLSNDEEPITDPKTVTIGAQPILVYR